MSRRSRYARADVRKKKPGFVLDPHPTWTLEDGRRHLYDALRKHLGPADRAVIQARRLLLEAVKVVAEGGTPRGLAPTYATIAAAEAVLPRDADWREAALPAGSQIEQTV